MSGVGGGEGAERWQCRGLSIYPLICKEERKNPPPAVWWQSGDKVIAGTCKRPWRLAVDEEQCGVRLLCKRQQREGQRKKKASTSQCLLIQMWYWRKNIMISKKVLAFSGINQFLKVCVSRVNPGKSSHLPPSNSSDSSVSSAEDKWVWHRQLSRFKGTRDWQTAVNNNLLNTCCWETLKDLCVHISEGLRWNKT